jgi:hypothetical protein
MEHWQQQYMYSTVRVMEGASEQKVGKPKRDEYEATESKQKTLMW